MSYQERVIDGVLHWRDEDDQKWNAMSAETLTWMAASMRSDVETLQEEVYAMDKSLQELTATPELPAQKPFFPTVDWPYPLLPQVPPVPDTNPMDWTPQPMWVPPSVPTANEIRCECPLCVAGRSATVYG